MSNEEKYVQSFVNAFGVEESGVPALKFNEMEEWDSVFNVNLTSALLLTQYCEPELKKNKGHIVNISSVAGTAAKWGPIAYCVSLPYSSRTALARMCAMEWR